MRPFARLTFLAFVLIAGIGLCPGLAGAENATATPEEAAAQISGKWSGSAINGNGKYFPSRVTVAVSNGTLSGIADLPESPADKAPKFTGTFSGAAVEMGFADFNWHLVMTKDSAGKYHLDGTYAGARGRGKVELQKE